MEQEKLRLTVEIDRDRVQGVFFLMQEKLTDEVWMKLTEKPLVVNPDILGKDLSMEVNMAFVAMALGTLDL